MQGLTKVHLEKGLENDNDDWIESSNCINNRCYDIVEQHFIDLCLKTAEKQLITHWHLPTPNTLF